MSDPGGETEDGGSTADDADAPHDMAEDRVYDDRAGVTEVFVAAGIGVVSVSVSADRIGRFGVERRCSPRDVAAADGVLAVATDEDVLLRSAGSLEPTGFPAAVAVGFHEGTLLAADEAGRIARREGRAWSTVGSVDASVAAIDGSLVATDDGVYWIEDGDGIRHVGHMSVNDVAAAGPYAATDTGLYSLGNGWQWELEGRFRAVSAVPDRAHAAGEAFYGRTGGDWRAVDLPVEGAVVDVTEGERTYAVSDEGTLLVGPEWRNRSLGVREVVGIAVV